MFTGSTCRTTAALSLVIAAAACQPGGDASRSRTDAGGVERWTFSPEPDLRIGTEGVREAEFDGVLGAVVMPSGDIVIADQGSSELRVFSSDGRFIRSLSTRGAGPGEIQRIGWFASAGDSVFATDAMAGTLHTFTLRDGFIDVRRLGAQGAGPFRIPLIRARLQSGTLIVSPAVMQIIQPEIDAVVRDTARIGALAADGDSIRWFGIFPGMSWFGYRPASAGGGVAAGLYTLGPQLAIAASADRVWIGDSDADSIVMLNAAGEKVGVARWPEPESSWPDGAVEAARAAALQQSGTADRISRAEALFDPAIRPARPPSFGRFITGVDGEMWVGVYRISPREPHRFVVFDRSGTHVAAAELPPDVDPRDIGERHLLGVLTSELGVQTVVRYTLRRGQR